MFCSDIELTVVATDATGACPVNNSDGILTFTVTGATAFTIWWQGPTPADAAVAIDYVAGNDLVQTGLGTGVYNAYAIVTLAPGITCEIPLSNSPVAIGANASECGCMDPNADNYNATATIDDGSCIISGCTGRLAINYNPDADISDQSLCEYPACEGWGEPFVDQLCDGGQALLYYNWETSDNPNCNVIQINYAGEN